MKPPCVILAGGRSSRMGGSDKCLLPLDGRPLLAHVAAAVAPQSCDMLINTNSNPARFARFGLATLPDPVTGFQGPLAGILTGMLWARAHHPRVTHLLSVPCDTPFLPRDLVLRLTEALESDAGIAIARDPERIHPTIGLWPTSLAGRLAADLSDGARAVHRWLENFRVVETAFPAWHFRNINTRADLAAARQHHPPARRQAAGATPKCFLKARENAASES